METDQKPVISVRKLRKVYMMGQEHVVALHNINLDIARGEVCCIFGTSGSGKSTLLNQLAGLEKPTRGVVRIGGVPISQLNENQLAAFRQKHIGFVFQSYNLLPELTAAENVAMPLMFKGIDPDVRLLEAKKMLCRVGLKDRMDHFPNQMSGGQQQRVGIARAFVTHPEVVFADEPTGNLDSTTSEEIMRVFDRFSQGFRDGKSYSDLVSMLLYGGDPYMLIADYRAYADCQKKLYQRISDKNELARLALVNTAQSGVFAADRAIREYAENIWKL